MEAFLLIFSDLVRQLQPDLFLPDNLAILKRKLAVMSVFPRWQVAARLVVPLFALQHRFRKYALHLGAERMFLNLGAERYVDKRLASSDALTCDLVDVKVKVVDVSFGDLALRASG